jgi:phosphoesterase RecJ-like protein
MKDATRFTKELAQLDKALLEAKRVLITAPGTADGDSLGSQLALREMLSQSHPNCEVQIINDESLPERYLFLPNVDKVVTPDSYKGSEKFDVGIIVDGGFDRAGRVCPMYQACPTTVFIDHHAVSVEFPYTIRIVEADASATTELIYYMSQTDHFKTKINSDIAQHLYLGLIFDTGFFRHSNTTPEAMELGAKLLRAGFDFTRVGERGMLERTFSSLQLLAYTLSKAVRSADGKIIWSSMTQDTMEKFHAQNDDREGIIDHLFLTRGIEVAVLFFELPNSETKVSFRSQGRVDVAAFARSVTERGGGHVKAAGALISKPLNKATEVVLQGLEATLKN